MFAFWRVEQFVFNLLTERRLFGVMIEDTLNCFGELLGHRQSGSELDRFQAAGYLDPEKRGDRAAKARAIECFITEYLP